MYQARVSYGAAKTIRVGVVLALSTSYQHDTFRLSRSFSSCVSSHPHTFPPPLLAPILNVRLILVIFVMDAMLMRASDYCCAMDFFNRPEVPPSLLYSSLNFFRSSGSMFSIILGMTKAISVTPMPITTIGFFR
jgi:hypothetical protein